MPKLIIYKNSKIHKEVTFTKHLTIGRDKSNDVDLKQKEVSAFHASIIQDSEGRYVLCDQASRNLTRVGGERIHHYVLSHGAAFQIVNYLFTFLEDPVSTTVEPKVRMSPKIPISKKIELGSKTVLTAVKKIADTPEVYQDPQQRLSLILSLSSEIVTILDYYELMEKALDIAMEIMDADRGFLALKNQEGELVYSGLKGFDTDADNLRISKTMIQKVVEEGHSVLTADAVKEAVYKDAKSVVTYQLKSVICVPLKIRDKVLGCIYIDNPQKVGSFTSDDLDFLTILAHQIAISIENSRLHKKVQDEKDVLKDRLYLKDEIILKSEKMVQIYQEVQKVAESNESILILGETGTGKELVARAIHNFSTRSGEFIAVNCAAIPENLLESELFGYEKGSFTGAVQSKPGLFEQADGGTIFLDEIGKMSLALQPKILRVLQDKEIRRIGSTRTVKVDVRVVTATNRDLKAMMKKGEFRQDLYYRIAVVELKVPPLKDRKTDIPLLANYFLLKSAEENNRRVSRISRKAMKLLLAYDWPGNVNELKNAFARAVLLGSGKIINPEDLPEDIQAFDKDSMKQFPTIEDIEKQHIVKALQRVRGNKKKTAKLLGITRDTVYQKMKKYGIEQVK